MVTEARQRQIIDKKTKNEIKKLERTIDSLEKEINSLKEELTSEEVMNNYKKYNEITDSIDEKEMELMEIMEKWTQPVPNWGATLAELTLFFTEELKDELA